MTDQTSALRRFLRRLGWWLHPGHSPEPSGDVPAPKPCPECVTEFTQAPPQSVTLGYIAEQRENGWPDIHPEDYCHRCGGRNLNWWTDSDRFNLALGAHGVDPEWAGIICPQCFVELHEQATGLTAVWRLVPDVFRGA